MNTRTIRYNIENNIKFACDGSNKTSFGLSQKEWIIKEMKRFYSEYGIEFETSVTVYITNITTDREIK